MSASHELHTKNTKNNKKQQKNSFVPGPRLASATTGAAPVFTLFELDNASAALAVDLLGEPRLQASKAHQSV